MREQLRHFRLGVIGAMSVACILATAPAAKAAGLTAPVVTTTGTYQDVIFPSVAEVRTWLNAMPQSMVWSKASGQADGLNCDCIDHGGFYDNVSMQKSLGHTVETGF